MEINLNQIIKSFDKYMNLNYNIQHRCETHSFEYMRGVEWKIY